MVKQNTNILLQEIQQLITNTRISNNYKTLDQDKEYNKKINELIDKYTDKDNIEEAYQYLSSWINMIEESEELDNEPYIINGLDGGIGRMIIKFNFMSSLS